MDRIGNFSTWFRFFLFLLLAAGAYGLSAAERDSASGGREVVEIEINGSINPSTVDYVESGLSAARARNASALLILMDTPGGLLNSTKDIVKAILNSDVPVIVYVHPRGASATSAGVFITLSAHVAAMAPGTSIGAAHPVTLGRGRQTPGKPGEKKEEETDSEKTMNEKVENYAASFIESIAKERGRNAKWAVESVRKSSSITAGEALEKKVIDLMSPDVPSLLSTVDGRKVSVAGKDAALLTAGARSHRVEMNLRQKVVNVLSTPDIAFLLLSLGSLGIFLEFYNPGMIFPGVAGLISLLVGFVSLQILPFNYAGLALLFVAFALIISEVFVTSYGLLSLAGLVCLVFGGLLLFDTENATGIGVNHGVIAAAAGTIGLFSAFVVYLATRSLVIPVQGGFEGMLGQKGEVVSWSAAGGKIYIQGEYWDATADRQFAPGDRVRVVESTGDLVLKIEATGDSGGSA